MAELERASIGVGVPEGAAEALGHEAQSLVTRPQARSCHEGHGSQQMRIDVADALAVKKVALDEAEHLVVPGDHRGG